MKRQVAFFTLTLFIMVINVSPIPQFQKTTNKSDYLFAKLMKTRLGFHLWLYGSQLKHGTSFTFNQIAGDREQQDLNTIKHLKACVQLDPFGNIQTINDGKVTPLVLGSIPTKKSHIDRLKTVLACNNPVNKKIGIFTLNECWECKTSGLFKLVKNNSDIDHYRYPTPDYQAPSFIDLLKAVHDLEHRDDLNLQLCLVHCKAGRGRSATIMSAYIMHVMHKAQLKTTTNKVEAYLRRHRPQVHLEASQKDILDYFYSQLLAAETFENLYEKHLPAIKKRTIEIQKFMMQ